MFSTVSNDSNNPSGWSWTFNKDSKDSAYGDTGYFDYTPAGTISSTGSGEDYMPPYMTVYCWQRTA